MIRIVLNESQVLAMKAEIKKMKEAHRKLEPGALLFQVFPDTETMEGGFVPNESAVKIYQILWQK